MKHYIDFFNLLNNARNSKKTYFISKKHRIVKNYIKILLKYNIVFFYIEKDNYYLIYLNLETKFRMINMFKKSRILILKKKYLFNINDKYRDFIIMNDLGFIGSNEVLKLNKGGIIFNKIELRYS